MKRRDVQIAEDVLRAFLKRRGLRLTNVRREIVREIFSTPGHFDAGNLLRRLRRKYRRFSRASLYRTLGLLVSAGLLSRLDLGEGFTRFESRLGYTHHDHLLCLGCGRIIEFKSRRIEALQKKLCRTRAFKPLGYSLQIRGLCRECIAAGRGKGKSLV